MLVFHSRDTTHTATDLRFMGPCGLLRFASGLLGRGLARPGRQETRADDLGRGAHRGNLLRLHLKDIRRRATALACHVRRLATAVLLLALIHKYRQIGALLLEECLAQLHGAAQALAVHAVFQLLVLVH